MFRALVLFSAVLAGTLGVRGDDVGSSDLPSGESGTPTEAYDASGKLPELLSGLQAIVQLVRGEDVGGISVWFTIPEIESEVEPPNIDDVMAEIEDRIGETVEVFAAYVQTLLHGNKCEFRSRQETLRYVLYSELDFLRQTCELSPEQRPILWKAGESALRMVARNHVQNELFVSYGFEMSVSQIAKCDTRQVIRKRLLRVLTQISTADQLAMYQQEIGHWTNRRRQAFIIVQVSRLDRVLQLTAEQRSAIVKTLSENARDGWERFVDQLEVEDESDFPQIIDSDVAQHLNPLQRREWKKLPKFELIDYYAGEDILCEAERISLDFDEEWWFGRVP